MEPKQAESVLVTFLLAVTEDPTEAASGWKGLFGPAVKGDGVRHDGGGMWLGLALSGATVATVPASTHLFGPTSTKTV